MWRVGCISGKNLFIFDPSSNLRGALAMGLATLTAVPLGLGSNPGEDMGVCKCIVPSRHGGTLNSRRATSSLVRLVEGEESWEAPDYSQGVLPLNWGETELNLSVTCGINKNNNSLPSLVTMAVLREPKRLWHHLSAANATKPSDTGCNQQSRLTRMTQPTKSSQMMSQSTPNHANYKPSH
ncbi:uncharacterized protein TNCV_268221 [Trichonephila clavipes]|nr:uncharacterized protein TNCV_268221 [Trichonephila clavipes]